jgi:hypothetical protein
MQPTISHRHQTLTVGTATFFYSRRLNAKKVGTYTLALQAKNKNGTSSQGLTLTVQQ